MDRIPSIPTIDLGHFLASRGAEQRSLAAEVDDVCATLGFLIVENHGVPHTVIDRLWTSSRAFFDLPLEQKMRSRSPDPQCPRGYFPFAAEALAQSLGVETPPDIKESFGIGPLRAPKGAMSDDATSFHYGANLWPDQPEMFRDHLTAYHTELEALGSRVLSLFAAALELPLDYFEQFHGSPMCALRCLSYPPNKGELSPGQRGAGEHADYGSITMLKSDPNVAGLEIRLPTGAWISAPLVEDGFIVNIGDMMARWTNDRWVSTLHRVTSPGDVQRQSIAFFHNASFDALIECIPTCRDARGGAKYEPIYAGEYLWQRFTSALAG
ncbi:MAG: 2-oxoglutarate and iron-dependent oxygenase domain-containing protein [Pseudomonadota bacterium]